MYNLHLTKQLQSLVALLVLALCCANCHTSKKSEPGTTDTTEQPKDMEPKHQLGELLPLTMADKISISSESMRLSIESVGESRCPLNVQCIQAGKAKVKLSVQKEDMVYFVDLTAKGSCQKTDGSCGDSATVRGYKYTLISLTPYPGEDGTTSVQQDKYVATVRVEKAG
jgi:hypothetical protein